MMVAAANDRIAECWEFADWPDLMRTAETTVLGDEDTGLYVDVSSLGEVFAIFKDNPATHIQPREVGFRLEDGKAWLPSETESPVWVRYRTVPTTYTTSALSADVPAFLASAASLYLASDLQEEDGQFDKAMNLEQRALDELVREQDKYVFQQNQTRRWTAVISD